MSENATVSGNASARTPQDRATFYGVHYREVTGRNQVAIPGMNDQIVHSNRGEIVHEPEPGFPAFDGSVSRELRSQEKQARIDRIFGDDVHALAFRQIAGDVYPGLAEDG